MDGYDALGEDVSTPSVGSSRLLVIRTSSACRCEARGHRPEDAVELGGALAKAPSTIDVSGLESELAAYENEPAVQSLRDLAAQWAGGAAGVAADAVADLLDRFLAVEEKFVGRADEDAATRELIKASSKKDAADVLLAHGKLKARSALARALVAAVPRVQALSGRATDEERARLERDLDRVAALEAAGRATLLFH